jgi:hypothetical protein
MNSTFQFYYFSVNDCKETLFKKIFKQCGEHKQIIMDYEALPGKGDSKLYVTLHDIPKLDISSFRQIGLYEQDFGIKLINSNNKVRVAFFSTSKENIENFINEQEDIGQIKSKTCFSTTEMVFLRQDWTRFNKKDSYKPVEESDYDLMLKRFFDAETGVQITQHVYIKESQNV